MVIAAVAAIALAFVPNAAASTPPIVQYSSGISSGSSPNVIASGPGGAMWFTEYNGAVASVAVDGTITEYPTSGPSLTVGAHPSGVVAADGEIWFTEYGVGQIGEIDPASGQLIGEFSVPSGAGSEPQGIAVGPDGALWFTEAGTGLVGRLDPTAAQPGTSDGMTEYETKYTDHTSAIDRPVQLVTADGYLWITLAGLGGGLDRLDPASAQAGTDDGIEFFPLPTTDSGPEGITIDPGSGDLWVSEYGAGKVVRVDPAAVVENQTAGMTETATPGFSPLIGTSGHDGQLWFAGPTNGDALLQLDPGNPTTQGPVSNGITGAPNGDATDAAGDVWFTEFTAGAVGVVQLAPAPTAGNPTIAPAQPLQDQLESCDPDAVDWTDSPVFSYQWLLDGLAIQGGTGSSYTPVAGDIGHQLSCRVTGANASGATDATSGAAAVQAPALTPGTPTITGTAQSGQTLTCDPDAADWTGSPTSFTYQWLRDGQQIAAAIGTTYLLTDLDAGHAVTCDVTGHNGALSAHAQATPVTVTPRAPTAAMPTILGMAAVGQTLTCNPNATAWGGEPTFTYAWLRDGATIAGAAGAMYAVVAADGGHALACAVTGTNSTSSASAQSNPISIPVPGAAPPTAHLVDATPGAKLGQTLTLDAAGSTIPAGERAADYTFALGTGAGAQTATCPAQLPKLDATIASAVSTTATVTVTTSAGTSDAATIPISIAQAKLPVFTGAKPAADRPRGVHGALRPAAAGPSLGPVSAVVMECVPAGGAAPGPTTSTRITNVKALEQEPMSADAQLPACATELKVGIIDGLGCFTEASASHPLPAAEQKLLCGHQKTEKFLTGACGPIVPQLFSLESGSRADAAQSGCAPGGVGYDVVYYSTQPVGIDGLEIDPVNGGVIALARAGFDCTSFTSKDSAYLVSSDAVVKVGGLPITLKVPDYSKLSSQVQGDADCAQKAGSGLSDADIGAADCLGSLSLPPVSLDGKLLPQTDGPIDLSVSPEDLGIELGQFDVPDNVLPLPVLPSLPLSGSLKVNLTGMDAASVAINVQLPGVLSDGEGHGLTGSTTLSIDNVHGLELNNLDIKVPSLAQLGLARLRNLEFQYKQPSYFNMMGTIDLSDVIEGNVTIHVIIDKGAFQSGTVSYASPSGDGLPLFGPLFLTQLTATLTLNPVHIHGDTQISVGPAVLDNGCGALGIHGTVDIVFGNPWTLDASGSASVLCVDFGPSRIFHADSDGHFSYGESLDFSIPGLGSIVGDEFGQAYLNTNGQLLAQLDGKLAGNFRIDPCHDFGWPIGQQCLGTISFTPELDGTISLGDSFGHLVGEAGVCAKLGVNIAGQNIGFDVGAGTSDLPGTIASLATDNLAALASQLQILLDNCDISKWRLLPPPAGFASVHARDAAAPAYNFQMPPNQKIGVIGLQGSGDPNVLLTSPGGKHIQASTDGIHIDNDALVVRQPSTGQILIEIPNAQPGKWTIQTAPGAPALKRVQLAHAMPAPVIHTQVTGHGAHRFLRYSVSKQPGLGVSFVEEVDKGASPIGVARAAHGAIRFTPAVGSSRTRQVIARITRNGEPAPSLVVGSYRPGTVRPGRATALAIRSHRHVWHIVWRPGAFATSQQLTLRFANGVQVLLSVKPGVRLLALARKLGGGTRPTAVEIVALRGETKGRGAILIAKLARKR